MRKLATQAGWGSLQSQGTFQTALPGPYSQELVVITIHSLWGDCHAKQATISAT
jgi:hypothetical protein